MKPYKKKLLNLNNDYQMKETNVKELTWDPIVGQYVTFNHTTGSFNPITITTNPPQYIKGDGTVVTSTPTTLEVVKKLNEKADKIAFHEGSFVYLLDGNNEYIYYRFYLGATETNVELWSSYNSDFNPEAGVMNSLKELKNQFKELYKTLK